MYVLHNSSQVLPSLGNANCFLLYMDKLASQRICVYPGSILYIYIYTARAQKESEIQAKHVVHVGNTCGQQRGESFSWMVNDNIPDMKFSHSMRNALILRHYKIFFFCRRSNILVSATSE